MDLLKQIIQRKIIEVEATKERTPLSTLREIPFYKLDRKSLVSSLRKSGSSRVIAEIKRASPSKGLLFPDLNVVEVAMGYENAGVAGISILTDLEGFGGSIDDILRARERVQCPILRKEFIVDEYQIEEARAIGADVILIIASALTSERARELSRFSKEQGLEVLLEVHDAIEIETHFNEFTDILGVNNRNLKTLEIDLETSFSTIPYMPSNVLRISESGISDPSIIRILSEAGFEGFLIGENFMKTTNPAQACREFIQKAGL